MLLCTAAKPLGAQNVVEQQGDTLKTAVVTASAKPSPTLQSAPLQVMSKSDFEKLGIKELHEAVKTFSGVQIKDYGEPAHCNKL